MKTCQQDRQRDCSLDRVAEQHQADHDARDARKQGEKEPAPLLTPECVDNLDSAFDENLWRISRITKNGWMPTDFADLLYIITLAKLVGASGDSDSKHGR